MGVAGSPRRRRTIATDVLNEKLEAAKEHLRRRFVERNNFLSDSDLLDAADAIVGRVDYDAVEAGDIDAALREVEHGWLVETMYEWLQEADDEADSHREAE